MVFLITIEIFSFRNLQKMKSRDRLDILLFFKKAIYEVKASDLQLSFNIFG